jgi:chemotaxis protein CheC
MRPLSEEQTDALREVINIGVGKAAASLSAMASSKILLSVPTIFIQADERPMSEAFFGTVEDLSEVTQSFGGDIAGAASLLFSTSSAESLVGLLLGEGADSDDLLAEREAVLIEIGNITLNSIIGTVANILATQVDFRLPHYRVIPTQEQKNSNIDEATTILAKISFSLEGHAIDGAIALSFELNALENLLGIINKQLQS